MSYPLVPGTAVIVMYDGCRIIGVLGERAKWAGWWEVHPKFEIDTMGNVARHNQEWYGQTFKAAEEYIGRIGTGDPLPPTPMEYLMAKMLDLYQGRQ